MSIIKFGVENAEILNRITLTASIQYKMLAQEIWNHLYALKQLRRSKI